MAATKRRARTGSVAASRAAGTSLRTRGKRGQNGWLISLLGLGTVAVIVVIAAIAVNRSTGSSSATPTALPQGTVTASAPSAYNVAPAYGIDVLDSESGLPQRGVTPTVGQRAPDFTWNSVNGPASLSSSLGKPVLIEFFAPWCPQCQQDAPMMNSFAASPDFKGLQVLAISASPYGKDYETKGNETPVSIADLTWYKTTYNTLYPLIFDPGIHAFNLYGYGSSYPSFWVIDRKGKISFGTSTAISPANLVAQVKKVM